jgi:hypothetical protein
MSGQSTCGTGKVVQWWKGALVALAGALLAGPPLAGHHSFAKFYFESDSIEIEGSVVEFQYRAPHAWVHVQGQDSFGRERTYAAEWSNPTRLERDGITKNTLKPGDQVRIWGSPSRDPNDNRIHLKRIERPRDKWKWEGRR